MRRHPLSLRKPEEECRLARNLAHKNMNQFFSKLKGVYEKYLTLTVASRIYMYYLDETGATKLGTQSRVIAAKGQHQVCQTQIAEHGTPVKC